MMDFLQHRDAEPNKPERPSDAGNPTSKGFYKLSTFFSALSVWHCPCQVKHHTAFQIQHIGLQK